jgi:hypothetical protein
MSFDSGNILTMKLKHHLALLSMFLLGLASSAQAHHRDFSFIRDWYLPYVGEREIESRTSIEDTTRATQQEFEFELGISKHFAIEPGIGFHQEPGDKTHLDEWDIELRFNFLDFDYNKVLPAINVEYENPANTSESKLGKIKFIASLYTRRGEDFSLNFNLIQQMSNGRALDSELLFGYSRPLSRREEGEGKGDGEEERSAVRGGFEYIQNLTTHDQWFGPTAAFRVNKHLNGVFTYLFATNHKDEIFNQLKFILEWEF